jgi:hypothetical protein
MTFRNLNNTDPSGVRRPGRRSIDYKVAIALGLIALVIWVTGRSGGSGGACLTGACLKAVLPQPGIPVMEDVAK